MKPPEESVETTGVRLHEALDGHRARLKAAADAASPARGAAASKAAPAKKTPAKKAQEKKAPANAAAQKLTAQDAAPTPDPVTEPHGRPVFAGKPYDAASTKLYLVVIEDENATKGSYAVDYLEEPDAVVVGVREITPSRPDPKAKADPRRTVLRTMRVVKLPKVTLDAPLGERPLLDAATGGPVELWES